MKLLDMMRQRAKTETSYFQAALLREDVQRLEKLCAIARDSKTMEAFNKDGLYVGWTQGDLRTGELKQPLAPLMVALFAYHTVSTAKPWRMNCCKAGVSLINSA